MIWFPVPDTVVARHGWPPRWGFRVTLGVWIMRLLFRLYQFHKRLSHDLAGRLLHVLEADVIKTLDFSLIPDGEVLKLLHRRNGSVIIGKVMCSFSLAACQIIAGIF
jgi:hypothetical protein